MARKAKPIGLHLIDGNKNHKTKAEIKAREEGEAALGFGVDKVRPPRWLSNEAKKEFRRLAKELIEAKLITNIDIDALAAYCDALADYMKFSQIIHDEGEMMERASRTLKFDKDKDGRRIVTGETATVGKVPHPLLSKKRQAFDQMRAIAIEFGFTPAARAKLAMPKKEPKKPTADEKRFGNI